LSVAKSGRRQHPAALHWEALSLFLENVMSRALTSDKATNATEAATSLLKQLLSFASAVCTAYTLVISYY